MFIFMKISMQFERNHAEKIVRDVARSVEYSRGFLRGKSDIELAELQRNYSSSLLRKICKKLHVPVLGEFYRFEEREIALELEARDAVRRAQRGEAVCGITGF